jgi:hypothetical protein
MSNVCKWQIAAGNNSNPPPDGAPENMLRSAVNNTMREMMAATARWYQDVKASLVTGGAGNAFTLTTNSGYNVLTDIPVLVFRANRANTGAATLAVDGLTALPFYKASGSVPFASGDIVSGQVMIAAYNSALGAFELIGPQIQRDTFPIGTVVIFQMATPPVGWTGITANDDAALRIVSSAGGQGGLTGGSTAASVVFAARTIAINNLPNVNIPLGGLTLTNSGTHTHPTIKGPADGVGGLFSYFLTGGNSVGRVPADAAGARSTFNQTNAASDLTTGSDGNHTHTIGGTLPLNGGVTQVAMDFAVKYVNVIAAQRS